MTDTIADALPREIARVSAKRDRWRDMVKDHPELGMGMQFGIGLMRSDIEAAVMACATGDVVDMARSLAQLRVYSDDD